jgi:hypothetical protein
MLRNAGACVSYSNAVPEVGVLCCGMLGPVFPSNAVPAVKSLMLRNAGACIS